jgi:hypothetical protein
MSHQVFAYPLRMPNDLRQWLNERAKECERSLNGEIVMRLKESKAKEETHETTNAA